MTTIRPDTRIGDLLRAYPELLDTLADYAPAFGRLRNPLLRRTLGRMTNLAQAASMGGVDLPGLLRTLRQAADQPVSPEGQPAMTVSRVPLSAATGTPPPWFEDGRITARFDARPLQAAGQNPLPPILKAAKEVVAGDIFCLRNTFEPLPLYDVLAKQGLTPWARQNGPDDWEVFFYRARPGEEIAPPGEVALEPVRGGANVSGVPLVASVRIDVSQLTPPEPMIRVLEALAKLQPGETLLVQHVQRPMYLYARLDEMGHAHQTWDLGPRHVEILIRVGGKK